MENKGEKIIDFLPTKRGCTKAIYDGRQYHLTKTYVSGNRFWKCSNKTCKRSITTNGENRVVKENPHNPDCVRDRAKYHIIKKLEDLKNQICRNSEPILQQYERMVCELEDSGHSVTDVPKFSSVKTALYDARKKHLKEIRNKKNVKRKSTCKPTKLLKDLEKTTVCVIKKSYQKKSVLKFMKMFYEGEPISNIHLEHARVAF